MRTLRSNQKVGHFFSFSHFITFHLFLIEEKFVKISENVIRNDILPSATENFDIFNY